jgi:hypothetical protein
VAAKKERSDSEPTFHDSELKALRAFVGGYLHQDFVEEHKTPAGALDAYCRETNRAGILDLESDLDRFIARTSAMPFIAAREIFIRELRSGWSPPNRAALAHLLRMARAQLLNK